METGSDRELLVLRSAKSSRPATFAVDFDRHLARRGRRDAQRLARWMRERGLVPDHIVSSPARRARETTALVLAELGLGERDVRWDDRVYRAGVPALLDALADCPDGCRRVLLVGHTPGVEELLRHLAAVTRSRG